jgi:hypothetical protein
MAKKPGYARAGRLMPAGELKVFALTLVWAATACFVPRAEGQRLPEVAPSTMVVETSPQAKIFLH